MLFMFDSFSFDMIKKFIYEDFNFPIYEVIFILVIKNLRKIAHQPG